MMLSPAAGVRLSMRMRAKCVAFTAIVMFSVLSSAPFKPVACFDCDCAVTELWAGGGPGLYLALTAFMAWHLITVRASSESLMTRLKVFLQVTCSRTRPCRGACQLAQFISQV